ncbi:MAG: redoxin domain-containing protein [Gammaproteobacteria bacterium]|nr:MAG: redoxin domain-containing protein [Gammaproteobacteria bacterium]
MSVQPGDTAPGFTAMTTEGELDFYDWMGDDWVVLVSHPQDFTPVCNAGRDGAARLIAEFDKRHVKIIGLSVHPLDAHGPWAGDIRETRGYTLNFPLIADHDRKIADLYGMLHPIADDTHAVRSALVISADKKVKLMITYPASTGCNLDEILQVIDSYQLTGDFSVATPHNWHYGEDAIFVPAVSNNETRDRYPDGWNMHKPYSGAVHQSSRE